MQKILNRLPANEIMRQNLPEVKNISHFYTFFELYSPETKRQQGRKKCIYSNIFFEIVHILLTIDSSK